MFGVKVFEQGISANEYALMPKAVILIAVRRALFGRQTERTRDAHTMRASALLVYEALVQRTPYTVSARLLSSIVGSGLARSLIAVPVLQLDFDSFSRRTGRTVRVPLPRNPY